MKLPIKTISDILSSGKYYTLPKYINCSWTGTALDILQDKSIPAEDRLLIVCQKGWIDEQTLRLFAVWCARRALAVAENPDPRSVEACNIAERYANGKATKEELDMARDSAGSSSWSATWAASGNAFRASVWAAQECISGTIIASHEWLSIYRSMFASELNSHIDHLIMILTA